jgi:hypothetical protein
LLLGAGNEHVLVAPIFMGTPRYIPGQNSVPL